MGKKDSPAFGQCKEENIDSDYILKGSGKAASEQAAEQNKNETEQNMESTSCADPVNFITGEVITRETDFTLPGRIPFVWIRQYGSHSDLDGVCGTGWETPADARLSFKSDGVVVFNDGISRSGLVFEKKPYEGPVQDFAHGALLSEDETDYLVSLKSGFTYHFEKLDDSVHDELPLKYIEDTFNNTLRFKRESGVLQEISDDTGRKLIFETSGHRITRITLHHPDEALPRLLARYEYDTKGNLVAAYDALDVPHRYVYRDHLLLRHQYRTGIAFYYEYDHYTPKGKCIHAYGDNGLFDYRFEYLNYKTNITNSLGFTRSYFWDPYSLPSVRIEHNGARTRYKYDLRQRPIGLIDPLGNEITYKYDTAGNLLKAILPNDAVFSIEYDEENNPTRIIDPMKKEWRQEWKNKRLIKRISPGRAQTTYDYNEKGDLIAVTDALGNTTHIAPDPYGNTTAIEDAMGGKTHLKFDPLGNVLRITDPRGYATYYTYDAKSRLIQVDKPGGHQVYCAYNEEDDLIRYTDEAGQVTTLEYVGLGEVSKRTNPDGSIVSYTYDTEAQLIEVSNEKNQSYRFIRDHIGQIVEEIDYWGQSKKYAYDKAGRLSKAIDALDKKTHYELDPLGRVQQVWFDTGVTETFQYDLSGNLIRHSNLDMWVERVFDDENQLIEETQGDFTIRYEYDAVGNRIRRLTSYGNDIDYEYDNTYLPKAIWINNKKRIQIERDITGAPVKENLSGHIQKEYAYTNEGYLSHQRISSTLADTFIERKYTYDKTGNLTTKVDNRKGVNIFITDPMGRIARHVNPEGKVKDYLHDPAGNLLREKSIDKEAREEVYEDTLYRFDASGNLISRQTGSDPAMRFQWGENNRLASTFTDHGIVAEMLYDAIGRRISKKTQEGTTTFAWDGDRLVADNVGGDSPREFVYYPGTFEPVAAIGKNREIFYFHNDVVGLPHEVSDEKGNVVWSAEFDALGGITKLHECSFDNPLRLQGQYADDEIGLYYNRHRYYDPCSGEFVSQDLLGLWPGPNVYEYAFNIFRWIDPFGLACKVDYPGNIVLRALAPEQIENVVQGKGILKPKPAHRTTPTQHVAGTKHSRNPWTSATRSSESANFFATHGGKRPANPIVKIDLSKIDPENILDVSSSENAAMHLKTPFTRNAASFHREVLIKGDIPPDAIQLIE